jgi:hypothetical protein
MEGGSGMRRLLILLAVIGAGVLTAGLSTAIAATGIVQEETLVLGEHTLRGKVLDLAGGPDDFKPGDRYLFRSELTDETGVVGHLYVDCSVHFAKRDGCSQVYDIPARGTVVAQGLIPASELELGGSWTLAVTGGTGEFENVRGSVTVEIVNEEGDTRHSLHLLP